MEQKSKTNAKKKTKIALLTLLAVMLVVLILSFLVCQYALKAEAHIRYLGMARVTSVKVGTIIKGMEINALNVFDEVEKHMDTPEAVVEALKSKTSLNPDVRGYFAAFEPDYFKSQGRWYEPYVHHKDTSAFEVSQVGSARHDYTQSEWYVEAKKYGDKFWSDPYYYYDGTDISGRYCTFVKPIYNKQNELVCVCGADMTMEWLSKELQRLDDIAKNGNTLNEYGMLRSGDYYSVILNVDGSSIANPEGKQLAVTDENVLHHLVNDQNGYIDMNVNGVASRVYYAPIDDIDWSVAVVVPLSDVRKPFWLVGAALLTIALIGIVALWLISRRCRYAKTA